MPTSSTSTTPFNLTTIYAFPPTAKVAKKPTPEIKPGMQVKWAYFNKTSYRSGHVPEYAGIVERYIGKRLKVDRIYNYPNEYLCLVVDEKTGTAFNVALCELVLLDKDIFFPNEKLIERTRVLACDLGLLSQEFAVVISDISEKFLTVRIFKRDFDRVKELIKPIIAFLKKEDSDEAEYILEQIREFLLMLSKEVHADEPQIKEEPLPF